MIIMRAETVSKSFGGNKAVDGVSLDVRAGQIHALIGPNGAGKSTFFNLLTKYLEPDHGRIWFKGRDITALLPHQICQMRVARCFQRANIYPTLTVAESVQMAVLSQRGQALDMFRPARAMFRQEVEEILADIGLQEQAGVRGEALSQGDKKRLELSMALGSRPELLVLDEPTAGMSAEETLNTVKLIRELRDRMNITVLFSEHDMNVVFSIADRVTVLHRGRILADGAPDEIRSQEEIQRVYLGGMT